MEIDATKDSEFVIEPIAVLEGHADRVWAVAWNPVQPLLASCSGDRSIRLWSYRSTIPYSSSSSPPPARSGPAAAAAAANTNVTSFALASELTTGHRKTVRSVAWAPSGATLAAGSFDATVSIWERARGEDEEDLDLEGANGSGEWECVTTLEGHESECKSVAYSSDGGLLASCSRDKSVWIWEVQPDADFECLSVLMHHTQDVKCVAWHPHEEILASASYDDTIHLYADDPQDDWYPFHTLSSHRSTVWSIAFSPDGALLASASDDRTIRIFRRLPRPQPIAIVSSNPFAGRVSINGKSDSGAGVESKWEEACVIEGAHERPIYSISWAQVDVPGVTADSVAGNEENRGLILSTGGDGRINVWHITVSQAMPSGGEADLDMKRSITDVQHRQLASLENSHGVSDVNCIAWCPTRVMQRTGTAMFATCGDDCTVRIWSLNRASAS